MTMQDLNAVSSEYLPNAATELENDLILHWHPSDIIARCEQADSQEFPSLCVGLLVEATCA